jgi:DNA-binding response OmpR family regulator
MPVLLLDPHVGSAARLATQLALSGFPTRIESTGAGAKLAIEESHFATLIVIADVDDKACLDWLDDLRRTASRSWMIVVSPRCDTKTCNLIYRHGGDACVTAPVSIDDLTQRLAAFQLRSRPLY